jgi:hypothetical protein
VVKDWLIYIKFFFELKEINKRFSFVSVCRAGAMKAEKGEPKRVGGNPLIVLL